MARAQDRNATVRYAIPAGTLAQALNKFADTSGLQLISGAETTRRRQSSGLSGEFTPSQALSRLLAGTGLTYRYTGARSVTIISPEAVDANAQGLQLDTISVESVRESAFGPVPGFVATQSATGTKTDTPLVETPQSITVVGSEQIQSQGAKTIDEAVSYSAGVKSGNNGFDPLYSSFKLRGFTPGAYFRDGLPQFSAIEPDPFGLERVEVLRGPSSILYGQSPPGGLINLVSKKPTAQKFGTAEVTYGNYNRKEAAIDFGGPVDASGQWLYRMTARGQLSDTQVDFAKDDRLYIAPALTWRPTNDTTFTLLTHYQKEKPVYIPDVPAEGTLLPNPNGTIPRNRFLGEPGFDGRKLELYSIGYLFEHRFNDQFTIRQNLRYNRAVVDFNFTTGWNAFDGTFLDRYAAYEYSRFDQFAVDNQAIFKFQHGMFAHTVLAGVDFNRTQNSAGSNDTGFTLTPINVFDPAYGSPITLSPYNRYWQKQTQTGYYLQDQIKINERLIVLLSGRWDRATSYQQLVNFVDPPPVTLDATKDKAFSGRAGAMYLFPNGLAPYISYSESFEPPPVDVRTIDFSPLRPITGVQYEAGVKYQPPGSRILLTAAAFDIRQQNVLAADPVDPNFAVQLGEVRSRGFELEGQAEIDSWRLLASYTYIDAKVTADADPTLIGNQLDGVSPHQANAWAEYKIPRGPLAGLGGGLGVRYASESKNSDNLLTLPAYTLVDALLFYEWDKTRISLNARNLFDEDYVAFCGGYAGPGGFTPCRFGTARTVFLTLKQSW